MDTVHDLLDRMKSDQKGALSALASQSYVLPFLHRVC